AIPSDSRRVGACGREGLLLEAAAGEAAAGYDAREVVQAGAAAGGLDGALFCKQGLGRGGAAVRGGFHLAGTRIGADRGLFEALGNGLDGAAVSAAADSPREGIIDLEQAFAIRAVQLNHAFAVQP